MLLFDRHVDHLGRRPNDRHEHVVRRDGAAAAEPGGEGADFGPGPVAAAPVVHRAIDRCGDSKLLAILAQLGQTSGGLLLLEAVLFQLEPSLADCGREGGQGLVEADGLAANLVP